MDLGVMRCCSGHAFQAWQLTVSWLCRPLFDVIHRILIHAVPIKNDRWITHLLDLETCALTGSPGDSPVHLYSMKAIVAENNLLFLVERDLDSGSAGYVVGITKPARTYLI